MHQQWNRIGTQLVVCVAVVVIVHGKVDAQDLQLDAPDQSASQIEENDPLGLSAVRDDSNLSGDDFKAYYALLDLANSMDPVTLRQDAVEFTARRRAESKMPTFVDMIRNSREFRGQPVHLEGHILQTLAFDADENDYGIEQLYEASLFVEDSQTHPTTVVFIEKPDNLPVGGEMVDGVMVDGYFLKTYWYPSTDNHTRKAPLILARTVTIRPMPSAQPAKEPNWPLMIGVAAAAAIILIGTLIFVQRSDRKRMLAEQKRRLATDAPDLRAPQS